MVEDIIFCIVARGMPIESIYKKNYSLGAIESRGVAPLLEMLKRLGGWPVLDGDSWDKEAFTWEQSVYNFRAAGYSVDYFLDFSISVDVKNSTKRVIDVRMHVLTVNYLALFLLKFCFLVILGFHT